MKYIHLLCMSMPHVYTTLGRKKYVSIVLCEKCTVFIMFYGNICIVGRGRRRGNISELLMWTCEDTNLSFAVELMTRKILKDIIYV